MVFRRCETAGHAQQKLTYAFEFYIYNNMKNRCYLCMVSDVKTNIFAVTDVAVLDCGTSTLTTDTHCWPHWNKHDNDILVHKSTCQNKQRKQSVRHHGKKKENNTSSQTHKHKTSVILSHFILWGTKNNFSFCQMLPLTPLKARKVRSKQNYLCTCCVWCSGQWWGCNWL